MSEVKQKRKLANYLYQEIEQISLEENGNPQNKHKIPFDDLPANKKTFLLRLAESVFVYCKLRGMV